MHNHQTRTTIVQQIDRSTVINLIQSDTQNLLQLEKLLILEKQSLTQQATLQLQQLLDEKKQLLTALAKNAQGRGQLMAALEFEDSAENWRTIIDAHELGTSWQELETLLARCGQLNEINDIVVHRTKQTVAAILNALRGKSGQPGTYNQSGRNTTGSGIGRPIISV